MNLTPNFAAVPRPLTHSVSGRSRAALRGRPACLGSTMHRNYVKRHRPAAVRSVAGTCGSGMLLGCERRSGSVQEVTLP